MPSRSLKPTAAIWGRSGWLKRHKTGQGEDAARRKTGLGSKAILSGRGSGGSSGRTNSSGHHQAEEASVLPANPSTPVAHKKTYQRHYPSRFLIRFSRCIGSVKPLGDHLSPSGFTECIHHFSRGFVSGLPLGYWPRVEGVPEASTRETGHSGRVLDAHNLN